MKEKFFKGLKKYRAYLYAVLAVVLVALVITISLATTNTNEDVAPVINQDTVKFVMPIANATISKSYNVEELQYDKALNCWKIHKGLDLVAGVGDDVFACFDGTVTNISSNYLDGTTIEISHADGLVSIYQGLASETAVKVGDKVALNQNLGKVGTANSDETNSFVHFELMKDGESVDPLSYIEIGRKD
ncbi:MAG: peptidoglycan DD-metalloendopeptidase family protein [Christensenellales bacterium]